MCHAGGDRRALLVPVLPRRATDGARAAAVFVQGGGGMNRSEVITELSAALALAQGEIAHAKKDSENPHFRSRYADLASVWDACRAALTKRGLSIVQSPRLISGGDQLWLVEVETLLLHQSGEFLSDSLAVPVNPANAQAVGSAITYARRYALAAFVGVAPEEDDANAASMAPPVRTRDIAADRVPEKRPPAPLETARFHVLGIVKRQVGGTDRFIVTGDDQQTYFTTMEAAVIAKAAKDGHRPIEIEYRHGPSGREIVRIQDLEPPL
jgi:hypothetical protein